MPWRKFSPSPTEATLPAPVAWVAGGALLGLSLWLGSVLALFRAFARLFH